MTAEQAPTRTDFEALYERNPDPFGVRTRWYERRKLQVVLAGLTRERYATAWDPACGTGDLALRLSWRCDRVLATDAAPRAVHLTEELCRATTVQVAQLALPGDPTTRPGFPAELDLVVLSEVLYYLDAADRRAATQMVLTRLAADGEVATVHWSHHPHDAHLSGEAVTEELHRRLTAAGLRREVHHEDLDFVSSHWTRGRTPEPTPDPDPDATSHPVPDPIPHPEPTR
ncbi:methyltransferase domain-containing protein [Arsenicicoccus sp. oral taxon 190]|uniref:methyltransferase domain-containing protein n=1 Tax=Arsenicicoccus sp. oral taxon 190 TaxID=1658671 RepID=UPI000B0C3701|nr:methyltransferase domain-containing protein [Arsenicicoccus sp. oral taxon 190]